MANIEHVNLGLGTQNNNTGSGTQYITNKYDTIKKVDRFLADLRDGITDPRLDKIRIEETKGGLLRESYSWIFENEDFQRWKNDENRRLLWIRGDPGKGKTMLLCGIIDELKEAGTEPIFFFCQASDSKLNKAESVLRGLLYMLINESKDLVKPFLQKYEHAGKQLFEDKNGWFALCEMITATIHNKNNSDVCLIVDALDECTSGLSMLLKAFVKLSITVRIIVTSRNWPSIESGMAADTKKIQVSLELNEDKVSAAVDSYIRYKVDQLVVSKSYDDTLRKDVQTHLTSNSNHTFLWVALVCQQLADIEVAKRHTREKLTQFPRGLDSVYDRVLRGLLDSPDAESCQRVLAATLVAYAPLSLSELGAMLDLTDDLTDIVAECNSLLSVQEDTIYFVHQSAVEYLLDQGLGRVMPAGKSHEHSLMASYSLKVMSLVLGADMRASKSPGASFQLQDEVSVAKDLTNGAKYSCVYWLGHLDDGDQASPEQLIRIYEFLAQHFIRWVESLSLLRQLEYGMDCLLDLAFYPSVSEFPDLLQLVLACWRFLKHFRPAIELHPPQVYSALVFSPSKSTIREQFQHQEPDWIISKPVVNEEWGPYVETIELDTATVTCLAFSPDGYLASASTSMTVNILCEGLSIHDWYNCNSYRFDRTPAALAFSPDSSQLACLFFDGSLKVCNRILHLSETFAEPQDRLYASASVVFSEDGQQIIVGCDEQIRILNAQTGCCLHTLKHESFGAQVTVAGLAGTDGIASVSNNGTCMLWQMSSNSCLKRVIEASHYSHRTFCANGSEIVTVKGSYATYWDTLTCERLRKVYSPFFEGSSAVFFSKDGTRIACVGVSRPIALLELDNSSDGCRFLGILEGDSRVTTLQFMKNDTFDLLASAGVDRDVKVWDITKLKIPTSQVHLSATFERGIELAHGSPVSLSVGFGATSGNGEVLDLGLSTQLGLDQSIPGVLALTFSTDGTQFVSMKLQSVSIWDANTGLRLQTLRGIPTHGQYTHYALHLDGDQLLLATWGCNIIEIWDVKAGKRQQQWEMPDRLSQAHGAMVFSDKATLLATSSEDWLVKIWEVATGALKATVGTIFYVTHLEFVDAYSTLRTNRVEMFLDMSSSPYKVWIQDIEHPATNGYYYRRNAEWITKNSKNKIWLPPEYRTEVFAIKGSAIALGCKSGRTALLRFK